MTQLWSSEDETSLVWEQSLWPARLRFDRSILSKSEAVVSGGSTESIGRDQSSISDVSSIASETLDFNVSFGSPKVWSSDEDVGFRWGDSLWPGRLVREDSDVTAVAGGSLDTDSSSITDEEPSLAIFSADVKESLDTSIATTLASISETISSIDRTIDSSFAEENAVRASTAAPALQSDVFTSAGEETLLSVSGSDAESSFSSSESNELLSIRTDASSASVFAPDAKVTTVSLSDDRGISRAFSSLESSLETASSIDNSVNTSSFASVEESFEVRSVIERDAEIPAIVASPTGSTNLLTLDFDFLVDANPALLVSDDQETISSEDVTDIEDETNLAILEASQNEVILE